MSFNRLAKNAILSTLQVIICSFVLIELYRFLTRHLLVEEIGVWSLVMASSAFARFSEIGLGSAVVRYVALDIAAGNRVRAVRSIMMAFSLVAVLVSLVCLTLYPLLMIMLAKTLPDKFVSSGQSLLPYALCGLLLTSLANIFLGALDGIQRNDLRLYVNVSAAVVQLIGAYIFLPKSGLIALGPIQLLQASVLLLGASFFTVLKIRVPIGVWFSVDSTRMRELIRYGGAIQIAALGQLLFDPALKMMLTLFGGLSLTGYYEIANRMILQLRSMIVSAFNTLVPYVAGRVAINGKNKKDLRNIYKETNRLLMAISIPYFCLIMIILPVFLTLWIGHFSPKFIFVGIICCLGWSFNTIAISSYFLFLAIGRLKWTVWAQFMIGILNLVFGMIGGKLFGGYGVLVGAMIGLILGSFSVVIAFHIEFRLRLSSILPKEGWVMILTSLVNMLLSVWFSFTALDAGVKAITVLEYILIPISLILLTLWYHPLRTSLLRRISVSKELLIDNK